MEMHVHFLFIELVWKTCSYARNVNETDWNACAAFIDLCFWRNQIRSMVFFFFFPFSLFSHSFVVYLSFDTEMESYLSIGNSHTQTNLFLFYSLLLLFSYLYYLLESAQFRQRKLQNSVIQVWAFTISWHCWCVAVSARTGLTSCTGLFWIPIQNITRILSLVVFLCAGTHAIDLLASARRMASIYTALCPSASIKMRLMWFSCTFDKLIISVILSNIHFL